LRVVALDRHPQREDRGHDVYADDTISHERIEAGSITKYGNTYTIDARGNAGAWDGRAVDELARSLAL
jgi:hypothetical protein